MKPDRETVTSSPPDWRFEHRLWRCGYSPLAGVDEAGRGALAGPVVAAAVILAYGPHPYHDSKTIGAARRERLADLVRREALAWAVGHASAAEVDRLGVLAATHLAAGRALATLPLRPAALVTDYLKLDVAGAVLAPARADASSLQVAAASILAKTERDRIMRDLDARHPGYGLSANKGYGSPDHLVALDSLGASPVHRRSFRPVAQPRLFPR